MSSTANKIVIAIVIIVAIGGYVYWSSTRNSAATPVTATTSSSSSGTGSSAASSSSYKDGTYTGSVANSIYGNVQVSATVSGGKLTDVAFLTYPNGEQHSAEISAMALPILKSEAIAAQSASVNAVSGATQTSEAFQQSLQSALAQAQA